MKKENNLFNKITNDEDEKKQLSKILETKNIDELFEYILNHFLLPEYYYVEDETIKMHVQTIINRYYQLKGKQTNKNFSKYLRMYAIVDKDRKITWSSFYPTYFRCNYNDYSTSIIFFSYKQAKLFLEKFTDKSKYKIVRIK